MDWPKKQSISLAWIRNQLPLSQFFCFPGGSTQRYSTVVVCRQPNATSWIKLSDHLLLIYWIWPLLILLSPHYIFLAQPLVFWLDNEHKLEELPTHLYMSSYVWLHNSKKNHDFRNIFTFNTTAQCFSGADFNVKAHKGKQMLPGGSKTRSALQSGYFDQKFNRIMEGEAFTDPVKRRRQDKLKSSKLNLGKAFVPSSGEKLP